MAEKVSPGKIQLLKNQRRKAQRDMDRLSGQVSEGKITSDEAKRRRALYRRVIARSNTTLKSLAPAEKESSSNKGASFLDWIRRLSPGSSNKKLQEVNKKAGG